jgi:hypothetical protein
MCKILFLFISDRLQLTEANSLVEAMATVTVSMQYVSCATQLYLAC